MATESRLLVRVPPRRWSPEAAGASPRFPPRGMLFEPTSRMPRTLILLPSPPLPPPPLLILSPDDGGDLLVVEGLDFLLSLLVRLLLLLLLGWLPVVAELEFSSTLVGDTVDVDADDVSAIESSSGDEEEAHDAECRRLTPRRAVAAAIEGESVEDCHPCGVPSTPVLLLRLLLLLMGDSFPSSVGVDAPDLEEE